MTEIPGHPEINNARPAIPLAVFTGDAADVTVVDVTSWSDEIEKAGAAISARPTRATAKEI